MSTPHITYALPLATVPEQIRWLRERGPVDAESEHTAASDEDD